MNFCTEFSKARKFFHVRIVKGRNSPKEIFYYIWQVAPFLQKFFLWMLTFSLIYSSLWHKPRQEFSSWRKNFEEKNLSMHFFSKGRKIFMFLKKNYSKVMAWLPTISPNLLNLSWNGYFGQIHIFISSLW